MSKGGSEQGRLCSSEQIGEKARKKFRVYVGFMGLEKAYERVNREGGTMVSNENV